DRVRDRRCGAVVLLCPLAGLLPRLNPHPRRAGWSVLPAGGQLHSAAPQATADPGDRPGNGAGGRVDVSDDVAEAPGGPVAGRSGTADEPVFAGGIPTAAESLARLGATFRGPRGRAGGAGAIVLLPEPGLEQRPVLLPIGGVAGAATVPARLQPP